MKYIENNRNENVYVAKSILRRLMISQDWRGWRVPSSSMTTNVEKGEKGWRK